MKKILIAEDDTLLLRMYKRVFTHAGYEIVTASNGQEAIEKVTHFKPHLIMTDVMMPKMTGLELLEKLKKNPRTAHIPVIFLTNLKAAHEIENAHLKGAARYIIKDENPPSQVLHIVDTFLKSTSTK